MNAIKRAVLPGLCAAALGFGVSFENQGRAAVTAESPRAGGAAAETATQSSADNAGGITFHFNGVPLENVLAHLSRAAGYVVYVRPGVSVTGALDAWSDQPVSKAELVTFLKRVLADHDLSVIEDGRTLTVLRTTDIPYETPIITGANPDKIPKTPDVVTQIIPVRNLNPVELQRVLQPLLPTTSRLFVDESANSLLLTDSQANVHRAAEIIAALDSVSASVNTLKTYPLKYADAKEMAGLVKELYPSQETGRGNGPGAAPTFGVQGRRGGPGGFNLGNRGNTDSGTTPQSHVAATADEHGNVLIVSAPEPLFADIDHLIATLDQPVEETTLTQVFPLKNADCTEMADIISKMFPDDEGSSDASRTPFQLYGQGNRGAQATGARQGTTGSSGESSRMQKLGRVLVVPDPRTSALVVSASETVMPAVADIIERLDGAKGSKQSAHVITVQYADLYELQQIIQSIYPSAGTAGASLTVTSPLDQRRTAILNSWYTGSGGVAANGGSSGFGRNNSMTGVGFGN